MRYAVDRKLQSMGSWLVETSMGLRSGTEWAYIDDEEARLGHASARVVLIARSSNAHLSHGVRG